MSLLIFLHVISIRMNGSILLSLFQRDLIQIPNSLRDLMADEDTTIHLEVLDMESENALEKVWGDNSLKFSLQSLF